MFTDAVEFPTSNEKFSLPSVVRKLSKSATTRRSRFHRTSCATGRQRTVLLAERSPTATMTDGGVAVQASGVQHIIRTPTRTSEVPKSVCRRSDLNAAAAAVAFARLPLFILESSRTCCRTGAIGARADSQVCTLILNRE